jgi:hypothetical protein
MDSPFIEACHIFSRPRELSMDDPVSNLQPASVRIITTVTTA